MPWHNYLLTFNAASEPKNLGLMRQHLGIGAVKLHAVKPKFLCFDAALIFKALR
jgi:hypothetical protein